MMKTTVLKDCKYIEKVVVTHINNYWSDFSFSSDASDNSDEEWIKDMRLIFFKKVILKMHFFDKAILKMYFLRKQFKKIFFWKKF